SSPGRHVSHRAAVVEPPAHLLQACHQLADPYATVFALDDAGTGALRDGALAGVDLVAIDHVGHVGCHLTPRRSGSQTGRSRRSPNGEADLGSPATYTLTAQAGRVCIASVVGRRDAQRSGSFSTCGGRGTIARVLGP